MQFFIYVISSQIPDIRPEIRQGKHAYQHDKQQTYLLWYCLGLLESWELNMNMERRGRLPSLPPACRLSGRSTNIIIINFTKYENPPPPLFFINFLLISIKLYVIGGKYEIFITFLFLSLRFLLFFIRCEGKGDKES